MRKKHSIEKIDEDISSELILDGRAVSRGIGIGKSLCLYGSRKQFSRYDLDEAQIENEIARFHAAADGSKLQLEKIIENDSSLKEHQKRIFKTHKLFLMDDSFLSQIEKTILDQRVNAEWAVKVVADSFVEKYRESNDKHLREKHIDLEDVSERLLNSLDGGKKNNLIIDQNTVVIAKEINPSTVIEISKNNPQALVTENGGWTSHAFILARELKIPAVTGVRDILQRIENNADIIVDGLNGRVIKNPTNSTTQSYHLGETFLDEPDDQVFSIDKNPPKTLDGFEVIIRANLDSSSNYNQAKDLGAKGIGLYRSELLFSQHKDFPAEREQFEVYSAVADSVGVDGVKIRTFDLISDQTALSMRGREKNPALGLRGIRLAKRFEDEFREQIRAILRASFQKNIDIVLPMISDVGEIVWAKSIILEEKDKLKSKGVDFGNPKLGSMIEVPAAILTIDRIFEVSDFVSVGTNDLVQYLLAVDRDQEDVADWYKTLHPAVLISIKIVLDASKKFEKPAIICGEMAGSPLYIPILIAYGADELSMNPNSIARIRNIISNIAREETRTIVKGLESCRTADDVNGLLDHFFKEKLQHLFNPRNSSQILNN